MKRSRLALLALVLGAWLATSGATVASAVLSFRTAPSAAEAATPLSGPREARAQAMRFNRAMFEASARGQLVLAALAFVLAGWPPVGSRGALACVTLAGTLALVLALGVVPRSSAHAAARIEALEAAAPPAAAADPEQEIRFRRLHRAYALLDLAKSGLLLAAAWAASRERKMGSGVISAN